MKTVSMINFNNNFTSGNPFDCEAFVRIIQKPKPMYPCT